MEKPKVFTNADMGVSALVQAVSMSNITWANAMLPICGGAA